MAEGAERTCITKLSSVTHRKKYAPRYLASLYRHYPNADEHTRHKSSADAVRSSEMSKSGGTKKAKKNPPSDNLSDVNEENEDN